MKKFTNFKIYGDDWILDFSLKEESSMKIVFLTKDMSQIENAICYTKIKTGLTAEEIKSISSKIFKMLQENNIQTVLKIVSNFKQNSGFN